MGNKDWSQYLPPKKKPKDKNTYVSICTNCNTLPIWKTSPTRYHYRWCRHCMEAEVLGPFKFSTTEIYDEVTRIMQRKRLRESP